MTTPIADQVRQMRSHADDEYASTREQGALVAGGVPSRLFPLGSPIPDAKLFDAGGAQTTLYDEIAARPAIIVLYRGAWCPYCNLTLRTYQQQLLPRLLARGAVLIAVSPQKPDDSLSMREKNALQFPVLSDPGNSIAEGLGVLTTPPAEALVDAARARTGPDRDQRRRNERATDADHCGPRRSRATALGRRPPRLHDPLRARRDPRRARTRHQPMNTQRAKVIEKLDRLGP